MSQGTSRGGGALACVLYACKTTDGCVSLESLLCVVRPAYLRGLVCLGRLVGGAVSAVAETTGGRKTETIIKVWPRRNKQKMR